jgi:hypothetical protein
MKELREGIRKILSHEYSCPVGGCEASGNNCDECRINSILALIAEHTKGMVRLDENQIPPHNTEWDKKERTFEAYTAGQNDMIADRFRRVVLPDTGKEVKGE